MLELWRNRPSQEPLWETTKISTAVGKLKRVDARGQPSTRKLPAPRTVSVASIRHLDGGIYVDGQVNGESHVFLLDTGASKTIVKPDVVKNAADLLPTRWRLRTATGDSGRVSGEMDACLTIGNATIKHRVLVADIEEDIILGMDIMRKHGYELDLKNGVLRTNGEEIVLHHQEDASVRIIVPQDTTIPERSELIIKANLGGVVPDGEVVMVEPRNHDDDIGRGIVIAKAVIRTKEEVPVRVMNLNCYPVVLKKGTIVGHCSAVSSVVRQIDTSLSQDKPMKSSKRYEDLIATTCDGLTAQQGLRVKELLQKYQDVFDQDSSKGRTNVVRHKINTGDATPIRQAARRLPLVKRDEAERIIHEMKQDGVIEPSSSPWASPVVLVRKKDGSTRFCVDYRELNNITKKDSYPLPRIDDTLDTLAGSKIFSTLDLKSGYWQVEMDPEDREKTAFTIGSGLWQFTVMPFGLCNAPATFERLMENVLRGLSWKTCLVYLDDVIVIGKSFEEHLTNLEHVFLRLREANLKLNPKKCQLFRNKVNYLGHVVSSEGVAVDAGKIEAVRDWPIPRDKSELRSFLGLCTYYRRYVLGFADIAKPLTRLTEEGRSYEWTTEAQEAFERLKQKLMKAPVLSYPLPEGKFVLDTDASNVGIGAVLSQVQGGQEKVIAYFSKVLSKPERNYCVTRRELLAVVKSVEHFYKYLYGRRFLIRTDHAALKWLLNFKNPEGQVARWIEKLQEYDFEIQHRAGTSHRNADALSRRPCPEECAHCKRAEEKMAYIFRTSAVDDTWQSDEIGQDQREDPDLKHIWEWKDAGRKPTWQEVAPLAQTVKSYWAQWDSIVLVEGLLKRVVENEDGTQQKFQLLVPKKRIPEVLKLLHDDVSGGHMGVNRTLERVRQRFYWVNFKDDVRNWCRKCEVCATSNGPHKKRKAPMRQYNVGSPFERVAIDIAGPFPESENGNKYILVAMDYFSKWVEAYALPNQEAITVADVLVKQLISRFGVPLELHSDQGRNFESEIFQGICQILGIRKTRTTALHPQSDGMVERMNRTMGKYLSKVVSNHQKDWDQYLHLFLMAYRSSVHETTGQTPASVLFGREIRLPCDLKFGFKPDEHVAGEDYVSELRRKMDTIHEEVRANIQVNSDRTKDRYDINAQGTNYKPGDQVWLFNPQRRKGLCPKLQRSWEGPYVVLKRLNDVVYRVRKPPNGKPRVVHFNRLAPVAGVNEEATTSTCKAEDETFDNFMSRFGGTRKSRHGVTTEVLQDLFTVPPQYALAHCVAKDLQMSRGIASVFKKKFGNLESLKRQRPSVGGLVSLVQGNRTIYYLVTKERSKDKPSYNTLWKALHELRDDLLQRGIVKIAIPKLGCGLDKLNWRMVRNMLEEIFNGSGIEILVCSYNPRACYNQRKTVDCYFFATSTCHRGAGCPYRHDLLKKAQPNELVLRENKSKEGVVLQTLP